MTQASMEETRERLEREVSNITQKHKYAMDQELKPYIAQLTKIAALNPNPVFIPQEIIDGISERAKRALLGDFK